MHPDSSSSIIYVSSGHSLKCRFRILEYWFSSSPSLMHRFMITSFLGQYSIIKSSVSATIAHWSLYLSSIHFLILLFLFDCVMRFLVSSFMKSIFDCTLSQRILNLRWIIAAEYPRVCFLHKGCCVVFRMSHQYRNAGFRWFCCWYRLPSCQSSMCRLLLV